MWKVGWTSSGGAREPRAVGLCFYYKIGGKSMGKRELIIVVAFLAVGTLVFQIAAPPETATSSFSFNDFFRSARSEIRGNPGQGKFVHEASLPVPAGLIEVRLIGVLQDVTIVGDDRDTIDYEFTVNSTGPDEASAIELAKSTELVRDDVGDAMILRATYPRPASQRSTIVMHVPTRMAVRVEGSNGVQVSGVAAVHLEAVRGDVTLETIQGAVTGAHQDGDLTVGGAASARLRLLRSAAKIARIADGLVLDLRNSDVGVTDSGGALEVDELRSELEVSGHRGAVAVRGSDGRVTIRRPAADTRVDVRRAEVEVLLERAVPLTVITTDEPLRLILVGAPAFDLDASATNASIQAADLDLKAETSDANARLTHTFGRGGTTKISLRNTRGDIVLRKSS